MNCLLRASRSPTSVSIPQVAPHVHGAAGEELRSALAVIEGLEAASRVLALANAGDTRGALEEAIASLSDLVWPLCDSKKHRKTNAQTIDRPVPAAHLYSQAHLHTDFQSRADHLHLHIVVPFLRVLGPRCHPVIVILRVVLRALLSSQSQVCPLSHRPAVSESVLSRRPWAAQPSRRCEACSGPSRRTPPSWTSCPEPGCTSNPRVNALRHVIMRSSRSRWEGWANKLDSGFRQLERPQHARERSQWGVNPALKSTYPVSKLFCSVQLSPCDDVV